MIDHFADGNREVCRPGLHIYTGAGPCNQQDDVARASADDRGRLRRAQVKQKQLVCLALAALACWFSSAAAAADEQQFLRVTQLKAQSSDSERQGMHRPAGWPTCPGLPHRSPPAVIGRAAPLRSGYG